MELTRKQVIEILEKADSTVYKEPKTETAKALEYAIASLKTDLKYDLMYDGEEIFTKDDMIAMIEELKKEIIELPFPQREPEYMQGYSYCQMNILDYVIQQKINSLKEIKNADR